MRISLENRQRDHQNLEDLLLDRPANEGVRVFLAVVCCHGSLERKEYVDQGKRRKQEESNEDRCQHPGQEVQKKEADLKVQSFLGMVRDKRLSILAFPNQQGSENSTQGNQNADQCGEV